MKFPLKFGSGKGKSDDDEDSDDFESEPGELGEDDPSDENGGEEEEDAQANRAEADGDEDPGADFDEDFDEDRPPDPGKRRLLIVGGAVAAVVLALTGAGAWWFLAAADDAPASARSADGGIRVSVRLPPKVASPRSGALTPPTAKTRRSLNAIGAEGSASADAPPPGDAAEPPGEAAAAAGGEEAPSPTGDGQPASAASLNTIAAAQGLPPKAARDTIARETAAQGPGAGLMVAAVTLASYASLPEIAKARPLAAIPDPALVEDTPNGPLPKVGEDGRTVLEAYARPFKRADKRPRIAIIITGLGLSRAATEVAIQRLPGAVTLAFDPYADELQEWIARARRAGHEVLLSLPLESGDLPARDPGPFALLTTLEPKENLRRLEFVLARVSGYVGVLLRLGSRFTADDKQVRPLLKALKGRGLMVVDNRPGKKSLTTKISAELGLPRALKDIVLDRVPSRAFIEAQLAALEGAARRKSRAVAVGTPYPSTLARVAAWAATLEGKKLALAPISALADKSAAQ